MSTSTTHPPDKPQSTQPDHLQVKTDKVRTDGWNRFDRVVHGWIGFGLNVAASLLQTHDQINFEINQKRAEALEKQKGDGQLNAMEQNFANSKERFVLLEKMKIPFTKKLGDGVNNLGYFSLAQAFKEKVSDKWWKNTYTMNEKGEKVPVSENREMFSGITTDVLTLSNPGHVTTLITQIFETKWIKPHLVRYFDKKNDEKRSARGDAPTEAELAERELIYKKLDNELAGKSPLQVWGARLLGIAVVIVSLIGLGSLDKFLQKMAGVEKPDSKVAGLNRVRQAVLGGAGLLNDGLHKVNVHWKPLENAVSKDANTPDAYYASTMLRMFGTEVTGAAITSRTQYVTLMFKELFSGKKKTEEQPTTEQKRPQGAPVNTAKAKEALAETKQEAEAQTPENTQKAEQKAYAETLKKTERKVEKQEDYRSAETKRDKVEELSMAGGGF